MKPRRSLAICLGTLLVAGTAVVVIRPHPDAAAPDSTTTTASPRAKAGMEDSHQEGSSGAATPQDAAAVAGNPSGTGGADGAPNAQAPDFGYWAQEKPREPDFAKLDAFDGWKAKWKDASPEERKAMTKAGADLAAARRPEYRALISFDPRQAVDRAVTRLERQDLPVEITSQLETPVSATGAYNVDRGRPAPGTELPEGALTARYFEADGVSYKAHVPDELKYLSSLPNTPLQGYADGRELAVAPNAVRALDVGEKIPEGTTVQATCPVSGETTESVSSGEAVTQDTPTVQIGENIITLCNGSHVAVLEDNYRTYVQASGSGGGGFFMDNFPGTSSRSIGAFKCLYIRVVYQEQTSPPNTEESAYNDMRNNARYYIESSYGKMTQTTTFTPLITLPHTQKWYIDKDQTEVDGLGLVHNDSRAAAKALGYDPGQFDCIIVRVNGGPRLGGASWGGGSSVWVSWDGMDVLNHECGHSLGLNHANYWNTTDGTAYGTGANQEYGNPYDVMGGSGGFSAHYNTISKRQLGWLQPNYFHSPKTNGLYRIYAYDQPQLEEGKRYAINVAKDSIRGYNIEYHPARGGLLADQALVIYNGMGSNAGHLVDTTPGTPSGKSDAGIAEGRTYSDWESDQHFTVVAENATTPPSLDVVYNRGPFPGNVAPTATLGASATTIAVGGSVTFTATASDANGDPLAYYWQFDDGVYGTNTSTFTRTFSTAAQVNAMLTVSDMKGGSVRRSVVINVGSHGKQAITGTITDGTNPLAGVMVGNGSKYAYTNADGTYSLPGLSTGSATLTASLPGYTFTPSTANPYTVVAGTNTVNWTSAVPTLVTLTKTADPTEGGANGNFRLTRTGDTSADLVVLVSPVGGTATMTTDYTFTPAYVASGSYKSFTIPAGSATLDIAVAAVNDTTAEGPETITLQLASADGYVSGSSNSVVMTLNDNDTTLPLVAVTAPDPYATEGPGSTDTGKFTFTRTGATTAALNLTVAWSGAATNGTDYTTLSTTVTIPTGQSSVDVVVSPINDSLIEAPEDVVATISTNAAYLRDSSATTASVIITDDDTPVVTVSVPDPNASEAGQDTGTFLLTRTGSTAAPLTVYYGLTGTASYGTDYQALTGQVTIPAGATSAPVVITPYDDDIGESAETVVLSLSTFNNAYSIGSAYQGTVTITDNNDPVLVTVRGGTIGTEGGSNATLIFHTIGTGSGNVTVNYTVSGTATPGTDYTALSGSVSVPVNGSNDTTVTIPITNDTLAEPTETVVATITPGTGYKVYNDPSATALIRDNDSGGERVMVSTYNQTPSEAGPTAANFYFSRAVGTTGALTVNYTVSGTATNGTDYATLSGTCVIPDGAAGVNVPVTPIDDALAEGTESVTVTVASGTGYSVDFPASATFEITDNDAPTLTVGFQQTAIATSEQPGALGEYRDLPVVLSASSANTVTVRVIAGGGDAMGDDVDWAFVDAASSNAVIPYATLTFAPGTTTKNVRIRVKNDGYVEGGETAILQLTAATNATIASGKGTESVLIFDDQIPALVTEERWNSTAVYTNNTWNSVTPDYTGLLESFTPAQGVADNYSRRLTGLITAPTTGSYTFWIASDDASRLYLSTDSTAANKVQIATVSGYTSFQDWDANASQKSVTKTLTAGQSYYMEVQHQEGGGGDHVSVAWEGPGFTRTPIVSPITDTAPRTVRLLVSATNRMEGDGSEPMLQVLLDRPAGTTPITVNYTATGTATNGSDYSLSGSTLTFNSGEQMKPIPLTILSDSVPEGVETIVLTLSSPSGATLTTPSTHTITLLDAGGPTFNTDPIAGLGVDDGAAYSSSIAGYATSPIVGDTLTYSKASGPSWLNVAANGALSGTPAASDRGTNSFVVKATNSGGSWCTATLNILVSENSNGVFTSLTGGSWPTTGNWSGGIVANRSGETADFSTLNLTADATVTLDGARTIGNLIFGDTTPSNNWILNSGSGGPLTLDVGVGSPLITVNNGTASIGTVLAGTRGFTKTGAGLLLLNGANTYTGVTTVSGGTLKVGNAAALGSNANGTTIASGAVLDPAGIDIGTEAVSISGTGLSGNGALINSTNIPVSGVTVSGTVTNLTLTGDTTINNASPLLLGVNTTGSSGTLSLGSNTLTKNGAGDLVLNGVSVTSGNIVVNAGQLLLSRYYYDGNMQSVSLTSSGTLTVNSGAKLGIQRWGNSVTLSMPIVLNGGTFTSSFPGTNGMTIASPINVTAASSITFGGGYGSATLSGVISGTGALTFNSQQATLTGVNTYTGGTIITGGVVAFNNGALGTTGAVTMNGGTLQWTSGNTQDISSRITMNAGKTATFDTGANNVTFTSSIGSSTTANLTKAGTGTLTLAASNTYASGTTVNGGVLSVPSIADSVSSSIGIATGSANYVGIANGSTLQYTGSANATTVKYLWMDTGAGATIDVANAAATLTWSPAGGTRSKPFTKAGAGNLVLNGVISSTATVTVNAGALTLGGTNTYTGATTVNGGTLNVTGALSTGGVTVQSGGTLGGSGTIAGAVSVASGATLAPSGTLTVNNALTLAGTAAMRVGRTGSTLTTDRASGVTTVSYGGALVVTNNGGNALLDGDTFQLFSATTYSGSFSSISLPTLSAGLVWETGNLSVNGSIRVGALPLAVTDNLSTPEDTVGNFAVMANDSDPDGDTLSLVSVTQGAHGSVAIAGSNVTYTPAANYNGSDSFTYTITDSKNGNATGTVNVTVTPVNDAPTFTANPIAGGGATEDSAYSGSIAGYGADIDAGDTLTYSKVGGPSWLVVASNGALSGTPLNGDVGANAFTVKVTDAAGANATTTLNITVTNTNDAPTFTANPITGTGATEDSAYSGTIASYGADVDVGDTITYSKVSGPSWLSVASNGTLSGTPDNSNVGANAFVVKVTDVAGANATATLNITVANTNDAPTFTANPITGAGATEDSAYSGSIASYGSDVDVGDTLTYSKVSGPAWLVVASNGALSGTPDNSNVGANAFTVKVTDAAGANATTALNITVTNTNDAPTFTSNPITGAGATEDSAYSGSIASYGADVDVGDTITYSKVSGPSWLSVASNGALSGTPDNSNVGANAFVVKVTDVAGANATATLNITVTNTNDAPTFTANPITGSGATEDSAYSGSIASYGADVDVGDTLTYSKVSGPAWLSVASNGALSGTPDNSNVGANAFTVKVTDVAGANATTALNITVINTNDTPTFATTLTAADATSGMPYTGSSISGSASDVDASDTLTYSKVSGPAWLVVASNGTLSGTPGLADGGTANVFTVRATDAGGLYAETTLTINVIIPDLAADPDGDGSPTGLEFTVATAPFDVASVPGSIYTNLRGWWKLDETSGTNADDATGRVQDGTIAGSPTSTTGIVGNALNFDGVDDGIVVGTSAALSGTGDFTVAAWVKIAPGSPQGTIIQQRDPGGFNGEYGLNVGANGTVQFYLYNGGYQFDITTPTTYGLVNDNQWHYVAATRSGTTGTVYVDGNPLVTGSGTAKSLTATLGVSIGYDYRDNNKRFKGLMDEVRLYTRALSAAELNGIHDGLIANRAPAFTASSFTLTNATVSSAYSGSLVGRATDADTDVLTFAKVSGPSWLTIGSNGALSGTPAAGDAGTGSYSVSVTDPDGQTATATMSITVYGALPSGWTAGDIGSTGVLGSSGYTSGTGLYTISGAGADIWGTADAFQYASTTMTGDGEIRARVTSQTNTGGWAKAGVMMRDTTAAGSAHAMMVVSPSNGFANQYRATTGGSSTHVAGPALNAYPNNWVRVTRCGSLFTTYVSSNGTTWTQVGQETVTMGTTIRVGLAVDSTSTTTASTATFDNVTITPYPSPWVTADIGTTGVAGRSEFFNNVHTLNGAGVVGGTADGFRYTYQALTADGDITVRIPTFANTGTSSRIGVMIRDTLAVDSRHVFIGTDGSGAFTWTRRTAAAGSTTTSNSGTATAPNVWVRLTRVGNDITAYSSTNGTTWTTVGTVTMTLSTNCYIGLSVGSGNTTGLNTSTFDNLTVTP
ncbi:MAG: Calx-beta domain-containing protein [Luteolibacter sp.]